MSIDTYRIHRVCSGAILLLSLIALLSVVSGYVQAPQPDEGSSAHIFQFSVVLVVPMMVIFLATADWARPRRIMRALAAPSFALVIAFAALYYLEHHYFLAHYR